MNKVVWLIKQYTIKIPQIAVKQNDTVSSEKA